MDTTKPWTSSAGPAGVMITTEKSSVVIPWEHVERIAAELEVLYEKRVKT